MNLVLCSSSKNHFACILDDVVAGKLYKWKLILLYGSPYLESRGDVWDLISNPLI